MSFKMKYRVTSLVAIAVLSAISSFAYADAVSFIDNLVSNRTSFAQAQKEWDRMDEGERNQARQYESAIGYKYTLDLNSQNNNNQAAEALSHEDRFAQTGTNRNWVYSTGVASRPQVTQGVQQPPSMMKTATVLVDPQVNAPAQVVQKIPMMSVIAVPEKITKNDPTGKPIVAPVMPAQSVPVQTAKTPSITGISYRSVVTQQQSALVKAASVVTPAKAVSVEPRVIATKRPAIQANAITVNVSKPVKQVKQVQPDNAYANQEGGAILATSHAVSTLASRQQSFEQSTNHRFSDIEKQQSDDRKEYRSGIAGVGAIAGLHYVENTDNSVAVGAADFKDSQGYALGYRHKFADNAAATLSAADTSDGDAVVAVSAAVGW